MAVFCFVGVCALVGRTQLPIVRFATQVFPSDAIGKNNGFFVHLHHPSFVVFVFFHVPSIFLFQDPPITSKFLQRTKRRTQKGVYFPGSSPPSSGALSIAFSGPDTPEGRVKSPPFFASCGTSFDPPGRTWTLPFATTRTTLPRFSVSSSARVAASRVSWTRQSIVASEHLRTSSTCSFGIWIACIAPFRHATRCRSLGTDLLQRHASHLLQLQARTGAADARFRLPLWCVGSGSDAIEW